MPRPQPSADDRGQAFTLEGFIAAMVVVTAVLFALQSVVITPTTGGAVDRSAQAQSEQQLKDALTVAEHGDELSNLTRYWDNESQEWYNASGAGEGAYDSPQFSNQSKFGEILDTYIVEERGNSYNVEFIAHSDSGDWPKDENIVVMGGGTADGVISASYTVTLYDNQSMTQPGSNDDQEFEENDELTVCEAWNRYGGEGDDDFRIQPATGDEPGEYVCEDDSKLYNVVEVRITVW